MTKELRELLQSIQNKKEEARAFAKDGKVEEAKAMITEINNMQAQFDIETQLSENEKGEIEVNNKQTKEVKGNIETVAFMRALKGKPLSEEMQNALTTSTDADGGFLVPNEVASTIAEVKRQYVALKDLAEVIPVSSAKGTLPVEDSASLVKLVDFDEVSDLDSQQPSFKAVTYALKNKGAITPISNALLQDEAAGLPAYVVRHFAKKAVRTENSDIIDVLKAGKAQKTFSDIPALKKGINKDLDPAILLGAVIICNQDAFHHLDQAVDSQGRPLLTPDVAQADRKTFKGMSIVVLSNAELPTTGTTTKLAPIFVGNMNEAVKFFDRQVYEVAVSTDAGFKANQTLMRVIQRHDAKIGDVDAYINGALDVTATI